MKNIGPILVAIIIIFFVWVCACVNTLPTTEQSVLTTITVVPVPIVEIKPDRSIYDSWGVLYVGEGDMKISVPPKWEDTTWRGANQLYATDKYGMSKTAFVYVKTRLNVGTYSLKKQIDQNYIDNEALDDLIAVLLPDTEVVRDPTYYLISGHPARKISWDVNFKVVSKSSGTTNYGISYTSYRFIEESQNEAYILIQNDGRVAYVHGQYRPNIAQWEKTIVKQSMESLTDNT